MKKKKTFKKKGWQGSLLLLLFLICFSTVAFTQNVNVSGVVSAEGETLIGVNILVKGTTQGTVTDLDGGFEIEVAPDAILVFSYTGFINEEVAVNGRSQIDVEMKVNAKTLDEVIVIGYTSRRKGDITGAVTSVNDRYLDQQPVANVTKALQGSASGITVVAPATPGGNAEIRIRGMGTINNNNPLWVVDGVFDAAPPPPSQVESIQILKDASSTAIYGARGANGVILVTTKTGSTNQGPQIEFGIRTGFNLPSAKYDIMTDPQLIGEMLWLEMNNDGIPPAHPHYGTGSTPIINEYLFPNGASSGDPSTDISLYDQQNYPITRTNLQGTDWLDEVYNNGLIQDYNLAVTGGSQNTTYSFHANYLDEKGLVEYTAFDRYALRANVDSKINNWLKVGQRLGVSFSEGQGYNGNNNRGLFRLLYEVSPLIPLEDEAGNWAGSVVGGLNDGPNPLAFLYRLKDNTRKTYTTTGNVYAEVSPIAGLKIKTLFGYDINNNRNFSPQLPAWEDTNGARSTQLSEGNSNNTQWNWSNTISYDKTFNDAHNINILAGVEARRTTARWMSASRQGYFSNDLEFLVLNAGSGSQLNSGSGFARSTSSVFGRLLYGFQNKYLFDVTLRRDGSSVLGDDKYGVFPAFSAAWRLSDETFFAGVSWMDDLKIRASYGKSGNDQTNNPYNSYSTFGSNPGNSFYAIDGSDNNITLGYQTVAIGNPEAKWETTSSTNIAIDATLFGSLDLTVDLWNKNTDDMLFNVAIPATAGAAIAPAVNIGSMTNKGIDVTLDYRGGSLTSNKLRYNVALTFSHYKNEITKLSDTEGEFITGDGVRGQVYTRAEVGTSFPQFFGYVVDGIFQTQAQADAHPENGSYNQAGNLIINDVNGDGIITPDDRTYIGSPHPDFTAGLNLGVELMGFDLSATLYASVGNDIANYTSRFRRYGLFQGPKAPDRLFKSWGSPYLDNNADAILPKASSTTSFEQNASTVYIEDGSFLRLQNVQLGYTLPQNALDKLGVGGIRLYIMGANLLTFTGYSGLDPEVTPPFLSGRGEINRGVDIGGWPISKQIMFGLNITL